jgi:hypothetical protein
MGRAGMFLDRDGSGHTRARLKMRDFHGNSTQHLVIEALDPMH